MLGVWLWFLFCFVLFFLGGGERGGGRGGGGRLVNEYV